LLADHCKKKGLKLYAIFDQHDGIPESKRSNFPYSLPHAYLPALTSWSDAEAQVIISASANHSYSLKNALDWPTLHIHEGFSNEEAVEYLHHHNFFLETPKEVPVGPDTELKGQKVGMKKEIQRYNEILECTACVPGELRQVVTLARARGAETLTKASQVYESTRLETFTLQGIAFEREFVTTPRAKQAAIEAINCMKQNTPLKDQPDAVLLNKELMYEDEDFVIIPLTPLAEYVLKSMWKEEEEKVEIKTTTNNNQRRW